MISSKVKQLGKDSITYGVGAVLAKSITVFLLPVYTRIFSVAEFGSIETLIIINNFLGAILVAGMDSAQTYFFYDEKKNGLQAQSAVITALFQWLLIWGSVIVVISLILSPFINSMFFEGELKISHFLIAFAGALFYQILNQSLNVYRLLYRAKSYIFVSLTHSIFSSALILVFIVIFDYGILGYFLGYGIGTFCVAIIGWFNIRHLLDLKILYTNWWPKLLKLGLPLLPTGLAMYFLNTADRWFIIKYHGMAFMGIYSVGAKFAMIMYLGIVTFRKAWWPIAMETLQSSEETQLFRMFSRFYLGIGTAIIIFITAFSPLIIKIFAAPSFYNSFPYVGILAWSALFYGMYMIIVVGIWKKEKTFILPFCVSFAALLNIVLNALLVPIYAGYGAAISTAFSFFIWNIIVLFISEKLWRIGYPIYIFIFQISIGVISSLLILTFYQKGFSLIYIVLITVFSTFILILSSAHRSHYQKISEIVNFKKFIKKS